MPGEDFPDLSDGSMPLGKPLALASPQDARGSKEGNASCASWRCRANEDLATGDPPEEVPEKGQESHLKTHQARSVA